MNAIDLVMAWARDWRRDRLQSADRSDRAYEAGTLLGDAARAYGSCIRKAVDAFDAAWAVEFLELTARAEREAYERAAGRGAS